MAANCAAIENAGKWRGCLPGCTTSADSSLDGNTTSRTSSASSTLPAFTCCSDIYETSSRPDGETKIYIGGEIIVHHLTADGFTVYPFDRFEDYDADRKIIFQSAANDT
jgi:hypothetical protein